MCPTHELAKIKVGYMKNQRPAHSSVCMLTMFCLILTILNYEQTESSNEHAKCKFQTEIHQTHSDWMKVLLWEVERAYRNAKQS